MLNSLDMDHPRQKASLPFSIENILRDDFPHPRRANAVDLPSFERWPSAPVYRYYAVRYSPVFMKYLPHMSRVGGRLHRVSGQNEDVLPLYAEKIERDRLCCEDEGNKLNYDDERHKKEKREDNAKETCLTENGPKRKRRNRSHFTQRQLQYLEKIFSRQQYLTRDERALLARGLEMTELQIRNWFQNQRYQRKHRANENRKADEKPDSSTCVKSEA